MSDKSQELSPRNKLLRTVFRLPSVQCRLPTACLLTQYAQHFCIDLNEFYARPGRTVKTETKTENNLH